MRTLQLEDVVFMYASRDEAAYADYGTTVVGWGGAHTLERVRRYEELGIHATGTMWCLTAGAEALHGNADLREAVCRDIAGEPIPVPWLPDHVYEGTPSWFGCTNHPTFRAHVRAKAAEAMSGAAHGLHVDDHLGSAHPAFGQGGCFCDFCMNAFRTWLLAHATPALLSEAGVADFEAFDYRSLVRRYATTREAYRKVQHEIPLHTEFVDCQLQLAAENTRQLGALASEIVGRPVTLSANTCLPHLVHVAVTPYLTYLVGEVTHYASEGTGRLIEAVRAYRMAETIGKPLAATAAGWDWAYVKEHDCEGLVRVWIALGYACGQRLMAPHRMWCFTPEKGTHWYDGPTDAYAPLYRFVGQYPELFRGCRTVGQLAPPDGVPSSFETAEARGRLQSALAAGDPRPLPAGTDLWVFPRERDDGAAIIHVVNLAYDAEQDAVAPQAGVTVSVPGSIYDRGFSRATVYSYDAEPVEVDVMASADGGISFTLPAQRVWNVIELR
jgi:hypothetical protein